jgi:hypothetical protein
LENEKTGDEPVRLTRFGGNISNRVSQTEAWSGASVLDGREPKRQENEYFRLLNKLIFFAQKVLICSAQPKGTKSLTVNPNCF